MSSQIEICNMALDACRVSIITSLDDNAEAARLCARNFARARDAVQAAYPWNETIRRASLPATLSAPVWGYARAFQLPPDCLTLWDIRDAPEYKLEGRQILTDAGAPLHIRYSARAEDTATWGPLLVETVAAYLAAVIAPRLIESSSAQEQLWQIYRALLQQARSIDAQQGTADEVDPDVWIRSRFA